MTNKELLYIQDVLGHEQYFRQKCCETAGQLSDPELKDFVSQLAENHRMKFTDFYSLLG